MKKNKLGYYYFDGKTVNSYDYRTPEGLFYSNESRHYKMSSTDARKHIEILNNIFSQDYKELHEMYKDKQSWEVICLCLEDLYETGYYDFEKRIEQLKGYGRSSTAS